MHRRPAARPSCSFTSSVILEQAARAPDVGEVVELVVVDGEDGILEEVARALDGVDRGAPGLQRLLPGEVAVEALRVPGDSGLAGAGGAAEKQGGPPDLTEPPDQRRREDMAQHREDHLGMVLRDEVSDDVHAEIVELGITDPAEPQPVRDALAVEGHDLLGDLCRAVLGHADSRGEVAAPLVPAVRLAHRHAHRPAGLQRHLADQLRPVAAVDVDRAAGLLVERTGEVGGDAEVTGGDGHLQPRLGGLDETRQLPALHDAIPDGAVLPEGQGEVRDSLLPVPALGLVQEVDAVRSHHRRVVAEADSSSLGDLHPLPPLLDPHRQLAQHRLHDRGLRLRDLLRDGLHVGTPRLAGGEIDGVAVGRTPVQQQSDRAAPGAPVRHHAKLHGTAPNMPAVTAPRDLVLGELAPDDRRRLLGQGAEVLLGRERLSDDLLHLRDGAPRPERGVGVHLAVLAPRCREAGDGRRDAVTAEPSGQQERVVIHVPAVGGVWLVAGVHLAGQKPLVVCQRSPENA